MTLTGLEALANLSVHALDVFILIIYNVKKQMAFGFKVKIIKSEQPHV